MKQSLQIYKLHFTSPIHLGSSRDDYGISLKTIASDTMYAALFAALAKVDHTLPENGDMGCTISSLFPFYQKDESTDPILFFPKPLKQQLPRLSDFSKAKNVKKVQWLDEYYFFKALKGENIISSDKDVDNIHDSFLIANCKSFDEKFISSNVSERVTIESRNYQKDAIPFYMDRVEFSDSSGLYFMVNGNSELVEKALNILSLEGIGTDRNVGNGFFEWDSSELSIEYPEDSNCLLSLSSYIPMGKSELNMMLSDETKVAYEIQRRGGWITSYPNTKIRKNVIYILEAGSVFSVRSERLTEKGKIVDLRPKIAEVNHPVWRCGKAIMLPIKI